MREWLISLIPTTASVSLVLLVWAEVVTWRQTCDRTQSSPNRVCRGGDCKYRCSVGERVSVRALGTEGLVASVGEGEGSDFR